jgi:phosphopantothenoylcysteine decarboxylase/phosphopantothenate--cysteine ligase
LKTILVCITGAVAATVMPSYVLQIRKELKVRLFIMVSENATKFVTPYSLKIHSGNEVFTESFQTSADVLVPHIKLTHEADLMLVMPATANMIAKVAHGFCDDLISTSIVASNIPVVFVPSMNGNMWFNKSVQQNVKKLLELEYYVLQPREGVEVEGLSETFGVMPPLSEIIQVLKQMLEV